jgi:nicotinamide phosphoribosyltransferase
MKKVIEKRSRKKVLINEDRYIQHLLETYPTGILSMVSDTFSLWDICTKYLVKYKEEIMNRDGKLVIRPDSGDPVDIICGIKLGEEKGTELMPELKGVIELLWDVFGGTVNEQGYKVLDPHIGAIYGDSITIDRANEICERLEAKGFASTNVVLGIGSFTYQYNTRDTFGFAMKATYVEVNGEGREIFKDPITDDGTKKSATGLLHVTKLMNNYLLIDKVSWPEEDGGELRQLYKDGKFYMNTTLTQIKEKLKETEIVS